MHTNEKLTVTYKRNGQYIPDAMRQINQVLRDWRRNESIRMNPKLVDLAYEVHQATGSQEPINVVSGYRSPVTNAALRRRSRGVARNSQHILGNAMDIYIPDVTVKKIRETALRFQRGGVGYYPTSRRPFVHIDVGSVRHWPRMSPQQLAQVFPDGNTLHIPTGGKPLPRTAPSTSILVASADSSTTERAAAPAPRRQQIARPTPGSSPLIVASVSSDVSAPVKPRGNINPFGLLTGSSRNASADTLPSGSEPATPPVSADDQTSEPNIPFDIAAVPLPDLRPVQLAALDTAGDETSEPPQPLMLANAVPIPTVRPEHELEAGSSTIALAYGNVETPPNAVQGNFNLASLGGNETSNQGMEETTASLPPLDTERMASLIEDDAMETEEEAPGIWTRDLDYRYPVSRDLVSPERAEGLAFAQLLAPQLTNLQNLSAPPKYRLSNQFSNRNIDNNTEPNRFHGPAVQPLRLASAN
ncbi:MAG: DUF882 domain-containing protein [Fimbriimonadaceae bacterium]|nr:DUF882 domain-containing protein [Alphaproteobacteria bacterium]